MTTQALTLQQALIAMALIALIIFLERAFPFILFSKKSPPPIIQFIEQYIPPMVMAALLVYCLKDINFTTGPADFVPALVGVILTVLLHLWKHNALLSIFTSTAVYMILIRIL